ncbi:hypothetical protein N7539_007125 [Penicillium diatomitis]|uniref:Uncharacterized protein n=1 Tax=Penicillium diatomitis TaxID=2819901 RepID=A0A9W9WUI9_9EURO|nr:uncharacterized protein N7539_007125 [Penicillium diatomitis]KAJ5476981.1 hypothetical protein N7539_007125 [Penicillium diatomitis]
MGKINLFLIGLLGPEFLLPIALGQWSSARASVKRFRKAGYEHWTLTHTYFADMGGFLLQSPGSDMFPIDATQLFCLVQDGFIVYPECDVEDIQDKCKSGDMSSFQTIRFSHHIRVIAVLQALWFLINCIIRLAQRLFLTTFELTTLSFILIFFVTSFCWKDKPKDVSRAIILTTDTPIDTIRSKYHPFPEETWYQTPLAFLSREERVSSRLWRYYVQILHYLYIPIFARPCTKPYDHFPSDTSLPTDRTAEIIGAPIILFFTCIFTFAWHFEFPTPAEKLLWRIAAVYQIIFGLVGGLGVIYADTIVLPHTREKSVSFDYSPTGRLAWLAWKLRNIHPDRDPDLTIPLKALLPFTLLCIGYCFSRTYILMEDLVGLRRLPESAFQVGSWTMYIPHWL